MYQKKIEVYQNQKPKGAKKYIQKMFINPEIQYQTEEHDENLETQKLQNIKMKWDQVLQPQYNQRPNFCEGATLIQYQKLLFLYGGLGDRVKNELYIYNIRTQLARFS